jgi:hypothetical protein
MINSLKSQRSSRNPGPSSPPSPTTCCSFEMIRASFATRVGKRGVLRYIWTTHPKPACTEQGLLISVRSGVNARAVAAAHQSSRWARQRVPIGTGQPATLTALKLITLSTAGHRRMDLCVRIPRVRNLACSQHFLLWLRGQHKRPLRPQTPEEGRPGRNDSRCAGIRK